MVAANRLRVAAATRHAEGGDRAASDTNGGVDILDVRTGQTKTAEEVALEGVEKEVLVGHAELVRGLHGVAAVHAAGGARRALTTLGSRRARTAARARGRARAARACGAGGGGADGGGVGGDVRGVARRGGSRGDGDGGGGDIDGVSAVAAAVVVAVGVAAGGGGDSDGHRGGGVAVLAVAGGGPGGGGDDEGGEGEEGLHGGEHGWNERRGGGESVGGWMLEGK